MYIIGIRVFESLRIIELWKNYCKKTSKKVIWKSSILKNGHKNIDFRKTI